MKYFDWNEEKNEQLQIERNVCFEDVLIGIDEGRLLAILPHFNQKKYPNQQIMVIEINHYAYLGPYIENKDTTFLKTIIPSRKATKHYLIK